MPEILTLNDFKSRILVMFIRQHVHVHDIAHAFLTSPLSHMTSLAFLNICKCMSIYVLNVSYLKEGI